MERFQPVLAGFLVAGLIAVGACSNDAVDPSTGTSSSTEGTVIPSQSVGALAATLRIRCERRPGRSTISVDANNVTPRNGQFKARVRAAGGTVTSALKRAVGDEVEFDFDSNPNNIAGGATRIPANFIQHRDGPDVVGILLNAQGSVVARQGVECVFR